MAVWPKESGQDLKKNNTRQEFLFSTSLSAHTYQCPGHPVMKSGWEPVVPYIRTDAWHIYWLGRMAALIQLTTQSWLENQLWTFHALPKHWSMLGLTGSQVLLKAWKFEAPRARKNYTQFCKISKAQNPLTDTLCAQSKALQKSLTASSFSSMLPLRMVIGLMGMIVLIPSVLLPSILAEGMQFWLVWYWCFLRRLYLPIYTTKIMQKQASKNVCPFTGKNQIEIQSVFNHVWQPSNLARQASVSLLEALTFPMSSLAP